MLIFSEVSTRNNISRKKGRAYTCTCAKVRGFTELRNSQFVKKNEFLLPFMDRSQDSCSMCERRR